MSLVKLQSTRIANIANRVVAYSDRRPVAIYVSTGLELSSAQMPLGRRRASISTRDDCGKQSAKVTGAQHQLVNLPGIAKAL